MRLPIKPLMNSEGKVLKPMIDVVLANGTKAINCVALIDTGTDLLVVDERILKGLSCPRTDTVIEMTTVHGRVEHDQYIVEMEFPSAGAGAAVDVVAAKLEDRPYQAIFGIRFLDLGVLHLDFRGESFFDFHAANLATE